MDGNICTAVFRDYIGPETEIKPNMLRSTLDIVSTDVDCLSRIYDIGYVSFVQVQRVSNQTNGIPFYMYLIDILDHSRFWRG